MKEPKHISEYDNYVFDLYGTLIAMRNDEEGLPFWRQMSGIYTVYGADYTAAELRREYKRLCREEEKKLIAETGCRIPEIKLEKVFLRLLTEAKRTHRTSHTIGSGTDEIAYYISNSFRVLSRFGMRLFPAVPELLGYLHDSGRGVFMLSNAQAVFTVPEIEQFGLEQYFDDIFLSSDIGVKKPEAVFFEKLLEKHSLDPERTVMVGNDFYADMGIALACGTAGAHINSDGLSAGEKNRQIKMLEAQYGRNTDNIFEFRSIGDMYNALTGVGISE